MSKPICTELDRLGNSRSQRWGARITNFLLHTQEGALYFRDGHEMVWIHGVIRERWNRTGFESGRFGWPGG
ncbi:hypothetical protein ACFV24_05675 [Nocardia fluminea]|uniref:hypothetical protein n=1 Tax=Nocardia fluminea TaxID=134984 RepID=UPI00366E9E7C